MPCCNVCRTMYGAQDGTGSWRVTQYCYPSPALSLTTAACCIGAAWCLCRGACGASLALEVGGTSGCAEVADRALQHWQGSLLVIAQVAGVGVVGISGVGGAVDDTETCLDEALSHKLLAVLCIGCGTACRALLAGLLAALGGVEARGTAGGTCRDDGRAAGMCTQGSGTGKGREYVCRHSLRGAANVTWLHQCATTRLCGIGLGGLRHSSSMQQRHCRCTCHTRDAQHQDSQHGLTYLRWHSQSHCR